MCKMVEINLYIEIITISLSEYEKDFVCILKYKYILTVLNISYINRI